MIAKNNYLADSSICCGCGACAEKCAEKLIVMGDDAEGFLYPHIENISKCKKCKKCEIVCPIINSKITLSQHNIDVYAGYFNKKNELSISASGGVATAISRKIIQVGGIVCGVTYTEDYLRAKFEKAESIDELEKFRGSKYIQADKGDIYSQINEILPTGKIVLFIGLPCEVGALKKFIGKEYENLYTCELICYGPTSPKIASQYIKFITEKYKSQIVDFSVRYKKDGKWTPPYLRAEFLNGNVFCEPFYNTDYGHAFSIFTRPSCYKCTYKGDARVADITIGDYWGCSDKDRFWNAGGVSAIFIHTCKGQKLVEDLKDFKLIKSSYAHASKSNQMMFDRRLKSKYRDVFSEMLINNGLRYACLHTRTIKETLLRTASQYLPSSLKPVAIKIYKIIKK